ncbi:hypothetical protein GIB67_022388 [Kingdonia uniflora]|uniref:Uncharacterized protein n=1 Tax=Kingdonia uniflora TaxID=39325 RepID=A0A7J7MUE2_9MAGN|nr:hypothetical protein GIB67_022388 [Kingdonia uniflora]
MTLDEEIVTIEVVARSGGLPSSISCSPSLIFPYWKRVYRNQTFYNLSNGIYSARSVFEMRGMCGYTFLFHVEVARDGIMSIWDQADIIKIKKIPLLNGGDDSYDDNVVLKKPFCLSLFYCNGRPGWLQRLSWLLLERFSASTIGLEAGELRVERDIEDLHGLYVVNVYSALPCFKVDNTNYTILKGETYLQGWTS